MARNRSFSDDASTADDVREAPAEDAGAEPPLAPEATAASVPASESAAPPAHDYTVAAGRSIVCLKGTIGAGQPIRAMDLGGGETVLAELVKSGNVVDHRPEA